MHQTISSLPIPLAIGFFIGCLATLQATMYCALALVIISWPTRQK